MSRPEPHNDLPKGRDEEAANWCIRLAENALSPPELAEFDAWIEEPENRTAFDDALLVWQLADLGADRPEVIRARTEALDDYRSANRRRWLPSTRRWGRHAAIAATILLAFLGALTLAFGTGYFGDGSKVYATGVGERRLAVLEDGSKLSLDADTEVEVAMTKERRELRLLSGRAKFDVAKNPLRPFSVRAGNKIVVATGTSFSVELVGGEVHVLLYQGHVEVLDQPGDVASAKPIEVREGDPARGKLLSPGEELVAGAAAHVARIGPVDVSRSLSWEAGQLSFDEEPLATAAERMNRYSRTKIVIGDSGAAALHVSGVYDAGDTAAFVEGLAALYDIHAERANGRIRVTAQR